MDGHEPAAIKDAAREHDININVTNPLSHGYDPHARPTAVRASVPYYNTEEELERFLSVLPTR